MGQRINWIELNFIVCWALLAAVRWTTSNVDFCPHSFVSIYILYWVLQLTGGILPMWTFVLIHFCLSCNVSMYKSWTLIRAYHDKHKWVDVYILVFDPSRGSLLVWAQTLLHPWWISYVVRHHDHSSLHTWEGKFYSMLILL